MPSTYYHYFHTLPIPLTDLTHPCGLFFTIHILFLSSFYQSVYAYLFLMRKVWCQVFKVVLFYLNLLHQEILLEICIFCYTSLLWTGSSSAVASTQGCLEGECGSMSIRTMIFMYNNIPTEVNQPPYTIHSFLCFSRLASAQFDDWIVCLSFFQ